MAKKYVPSGYQIININTDNVDNDGYLIETEDVKILKEILKLNFLNGLVRKPVYICDKATKICGFANISNTTLSIIGNYSIVGGVWDSLSGFSISYDDSDDKLFIQLQEI